jgi:hypothetical protein
MHLLSIGIAKSIWLFDINQLNPTGKSIFPDILLWIGNKYSFQTFPKSVADLDAEKKGYLFKTGEFQSDDGAIALNFSLYGDGVVAETWASTEKADAFLDELFHSAASKYGLVRPNNLRKQYISEVTVRLDHPLSNLNSKILQFCDSINGLFARHHLPPFELTGMAFAPDTSATAYRPPGLQIERKLNIPFDENSFWSKSPFTTKDHLFALEEFEKLLADSGGTTSAVKLESVRAVRLED